MTIDEVLDTSTVAMCLAIDAYEKLGDAGREVIEPPNEIDPKPTPVSEERAQRAIDIATEYLEAHGASGGMEQVVYVEHWGPIEDSVTIHFAFDEPTHLPHALGLPGGDEPAGEVKAFDDKTARQTRPVESEIDKSIFQGAMAADVLVDVAGGSPIWIMPLREAMWCRFGN